MVNLMDVGANPEFWSVKVRNNPCYKPYLEERLKIWAESCEGKDIPAVKYSDFKLFKENGNRSIYEGKYFLKRRQLGNSAILALVYPEEEKYLNFLMDAIFAVCDEYTWCLPAHQTALEVNNNVHLDLFASETGFALAQIYTLLGDRLAPLIRDRIRVEIDRRIMTPFESGTHYWWADKCTNNWAAVCGGSIGCTTMLMHPEKFEQFKPRIDKIMENYLSGFKDDGYCLEGIHYWHYGFGFFVTYADMVKTFTNGKVDYFKLDKVRAIATFIQKMFLGGNCGVSFADGMRHIEYHIGLVHYLKKLYPDDVKVFPPENAYFDDNCCRFNWLVRAATWLDEDIYKSSKIGVVNAEYYAEESQWFIKTTDCYGFASKAGFNNEHHNQNDVGSFIFAKDGKQILCDLGRGAYTRQYFQADTRYSILECSSRGHSLPLFGDEGVQLFGEKYKAENVVHTDGKFSMDIAKAYSIEGLDSIKREFCCYNKSVTLKDSFIYNGNLPINEHLISVIKPEIKENSIIIDSATISFDNSKYEVTLTEDSGTANKLVYIINFKLKDGVNEFEIIME